LVTTDRDRLLLLARHLDAFQPPDYTFGDWEPSWTDADAGGWVTPFDWPTWLASDEGQALSRHPEAVARASADDLGRLLTACVRADRFSEGTLGWAYESGLLTAILRRAKVLAEVSPRRSA
jgi:hypothetical protein